MTPARHLHPSELAAMDVLAALHREFGISAQFTADVVAVTAGEPMPGSLGSLAMLGYVRQRMDRGNVAYSLSERGFARLAGVPEDLVETDPGG